MIVVFPRDSSKRLPGDDIWNHAHSSLPFNLCARMQGASEKKKLHGFLGDLLRVGCVKVVANGCSHMSLDFLSFRDFSTSPHICAGGKRWYVVSSMNLLYQYFSQQATLQQVPSLYVPQTNSYRKIRMYLALTSVNSIILLPNTQWMQYSTDQTDFVFSGYDRVYSLSPGATF